MGCKDNYFDCGILCAFWLQHLFEICGVACMCVCVILALVRWLKTDDIHSVETYFLQFTDYLSWNAKCTEVCSGAEDCGLCGDLYLVYVYTMMISYFLSFSIFSKVLLSINPKMLYYECYCRPVVSMYFTQRWLQYCFQKLVFSGSLNITQIHSQNT